MAVCFLNTIFVTYKAYEKILFNISAIFSQQSCVLKPQEFYACYQK